ncbi:MAG: YfcC family protein, partial [Bacillota bacterium]|nr:YfcC family protein [Bacillota bacterium]
NGSADSEEKMTARQKLVLVVFVVCFGIIIYNLVVNGWYMDEMCSVFLLMGVISGIVGGLSINEMGSEFVNGMKDFVYAGMIIGISRGILCIAENGLIIDTILFSLVSVLKTVPAWLYTTAMYFVQVIFSIFVPTTSGVAALTMPVLAPLTEFLGFNPEGAVTCYQHACKLTLMLSPAAPVTVAGITMCRLTFQQWWKTIWKFMGLIMIITIGFSVISSIMP